MKWIATVLAAVLALLWALSPGSASAKQPDPLIDPPSGGNGSRFQAVGQFGWNPGETVTLRVGFTTADPLTFAGPFPFVRQVAVLRDGTWSFPINVNDQLLGAPLGTEPGFIVVRAESASQTRVNAYVYTVDGSRPAGADALAALGFGPGGSAPAWAVALALFAAGTGALLVTSGGWRRRTEAR